MSGQRSRVDRRALLLGVLAGASGAAFVAFALASGVGAGAAFPLLVLWFVLVVLAVKLARRLRSLVARRRGGA